jgi:hypothetical protein
MDFPVSELSDLYRLELTAAGNFGMLKPGEHGRPLTVESVIFLVLFLLAWATLALGEQ